jgi:hypothetical protein
MFVKHDGSRKRVKPRMGWTYCVEMNLRNLGMVKWKTKAQERDG